MLETKKIKQEEIGADEETPAKIQQPNLIQNLNISFPIQPILKYPVGKKIQWINILKFFYHKQNKTRYRKHIRMHFLPSS